MYDGCMCFELAEDWEDRIDKFRHAFLPVWSRTKNIGAGYLHFFVVHLPEICRKYNRGLSSVVSDEVID